MAVGALVSDLLYTHRLPMLNLQRLAFLVISFTLVVITVTQRINRNDGVIARRAQEFGLRT